MATPSSPIFEICVSPVSSRPGQVAPILRTTWSPGTPPPTWPTPSKSSPDHHVHVRSVASGRSSRAIVRSGTPFPDADGLDMMTTLLSGASHRLHAADTNAPTSPR